MAERLTLRLVIRCGFVLTMALSSVGAGAARAENTLAGGSSVQQAIDFFINLRLQTEAANPAVAATDAALARRLTLDLAGRIPTVYETQSYVESSGADKREHLVDRLMASDEFVQHEANQFDTLLMYDSGGSVRDYLEKAFSERRPWDVMFRELLLGEVDDDEQQGAIGFVRARAKDIDRLTNDASVLFFGVNISCAKCHDHPLVADWTQDHFYGMKSFFNRTFENGGFVGERDYGAVSFKTTAGESKNAQVMFLTGRQAPEPPAPEPGKDAKQQEKKTLDELKKNKQPPPPPSFSRRALLVETGLAPGQRDFFARSIVNHVWKRYFGRGLVSPVDQMHSENPPSHPRLLQWLAEDFAAHGYDLRRLERGIVLSDAYARSSRWEHGERLPADLFAVAEARPLSPRQYAVSLHLASANPDRFTPDHGRDEIARRLQQIRDKARGLANNLDQPRDDFQVSAAEALLFSNGEQVQNTLLRDSDDTLLGKLATIEDPRQLIETAVWATLSRPPQADEVELLSQYLDQRSDRRAEACRQIVWALLAGSENRFNH